MAALYVGTRHESGIATVRVDPGGALNMRLDLRNHSPTGFEWGYEGSGPAQLALAICAHALRDDAAAQEVYQEFKREVVAHLPRDSGWRLEAETVLMKIRQILDHRAIRARHSLGEHEGSG